MKKLVLIGLSLVAAASSFATTLSTNLSGANTNLLLTSPMIIRQIVLNNTGTQSVAIGLFDNNTAAITRSNNVYTNYTQAVSSYTNIYTNDYITGTLYVTNIYNVLSNTASVVAAATNSLSPIVMLMVPTNNSVTYVPAVPLTANFGLVTTNKDSVTLTIEYLRTF